MRTIWMCLALMLSTASQAVSPTPYAFGVLNHRGAQSLGLPGARGFVAAGDRAYDNYRNFFKHTQVPVNA